MLVVCGAVGVDDGHDLDDCNAKQQIRLLKGICWQQQHVG